MKRSNQDASRPVINDPQFFRQRIQQALDLARRVDNLPDQTLGVINDAGRLLLSDRATRQEQEFAAAILTFAIESGRGTPVTREVVCNRCRNPAFEKVAPPIVIGAIGGSGTRALVSLLDNMGVELGRLVRDDSRDSVPIGNFLHAWLWACSSTAGPYNPDAVRDFKFALSLHWYGASEQLLFNGPWGWKNPRSIWIVPFLRSVFPNLKFVHLIRDPRDMALSDNKNVLAWHGRVLLGTHYSTDTLLNYLRLWSVANSGLAAYAERCMSPDSYLTVRYEDLCAHPYEVVSKLAAFCRLALQPEDLERAVAQIKPSRHLQRWTKNRKRFAQYSSLLDKDLERLGYPSS